MDLAEIVHINGHVREEIKEKIKGVSSDMVPERYVLSFESFTHYLVVLVLSSCFEKVGAET